MTSAHPAAPAQPDPPPEAIWAALLEDDGRNQNIIGRFEGKIGIIGGLVATYISMVGVAAAILIGRTHLIVNARSMVTGGLAGLAFVVEVVMLGIGLWPILRDLGRDKSAEELRERILARARGLAPTKADFTQAHRAQKIVHLRAAAIKTMLVIFIIMVLATFLMFIFLLVPL